MLVRKETRGSERVGRGYPLVEDRMQAEMMRLVRGLERPVSRSEMTEALGVSRSKVSLEVGRLIEGGLLVEDGLAESEGRQEHKICAPCLDELPDLLCSVRPEPIEHHHLPLANRGCQEVLNVGFKGFRVRSSL